ncbi:MAG: hypothetical protein K2L54_02850 [Clostridiales bacterium]|nr:hypothetical protein [Clostridiales bacterium]
MSKNKNKTNKSGSVTVVGSHKKANIIVSIVVGIAALILIAVAVLCAVRVDPLDGLKRPERYDLYKVGTSSPVSTNDGEQSKIRNALNDMDFSVMNAILQWNWDYSYNFKRDADGNKIKMSAEEVGNIGATNSEYMVEFIYKTAQINYDPTEDKSVVDYSTAQSLKVDGETIYFDRVKILIGNTEGSVGEITLYPYIYDRVNNKVADGGAAYDSYEITPIKVRANTTDAFAALAEIVRLNEIG